MTRPQSGASLQRVRRQKNSGDTLRGLLAALLMSAIVIGVPVLLVVFIRNPLPDLASENLATDAVSATFIIKIIVCIVWLAWAQLAACLLVEMVAGVRGSGMPWRVPFAAGAQQDFARRLVMAVLLLATAGQGLSSAVGPGGGAADHPAGATASVASSIMQVGQMAAGQADAASQQAQQAVSQQSQIASTPVMNLGGKVTKEYIVMPPDGRHHDTLWDIADRHLGSGMQPWKASLGQRLSAEMMARGYALGSIRADLAVLGRSMEGFLATTVILAVSGFVFGPFLYVLMRAVGTNLGTTMPVLLGLIFAVIAAALPAVQVRREAEVKRRDFRHAVGSFLDLVAMNLAGGRGVPESLMTAAGVGGGWPFARLRDTLAFARLQGLTPWAALGRLGDELNVDELRDLAAALALVADDGAKVRSSLSARATTMRRRELSETEGKAQERSQSMIVAQLIICFGFLLFLAYPAVHNIFGV